MKFLKIIYYPLTLLVSYCQVPFGLSVLISLVTLRQNCERDTQIALGFQDYAKTRKPRSRIPKGKINYSANGEIITFEVVL